MREMQQINHRNGTKTYRSLYSKGPSFVDPNQGQLLSRYLNAGAKPAFYMSVHNEETDSVRWSAMGGGHYYEQIQDRLFIDILTDTAMPVIAGSGSHTVRVVDVGGNIGYFTLRSAAVATLLQVPHELIAFEPNPVNIARFCESLWLNADTFFAPSTWRKTVDIYQQGVSDKAGILKFSFPNSNNPGTYRNISRSGRCSVATVAPGKSASEKGGPDRKPFLEIHCSTANGRNSCDHTR
jgi:FkbM family methyltransferase